MWWVYAILSALFASLTAIFGKLGVANINSNLATGIRTVVILVMIWIIILTRGEAKGINTLSKQNIIFLVVSGIATGLSWLFYFKALQLGNVSQVAPIDKLSVALTIILAMIFLGETLTLKTAIGAGLIVWVTAINFKPADTHGQAHLQVAQSRHSNPNLQKSLPFPDRLKLHFFLPLFLKK